MKLAHLVWGLAPPLVLACAAGVKTNPTGGTGGSAGHGGATTSASSVVASSVQSSSQSTGTGGSPGTGGTGGVGGVPGSCLHQADCKALDDACNVGACDNNMCVKAPANDGAMCDDGLFCTTNDVCAQGTCTGTPMTCPSNGQCTVGMCDEMQKMCITVPGDNAAPCVSMDPCFTGGSCANGACVNGIPKDCSVFNDQCNQGTCDPVAGCQKTPVSNGTACNDNLFCTVNDTCTAGVCKGTPNPCMAVPNPCMVPSCNEAQKSCVAVVGNNGAACASANQCVVGTTCNNGVCAGGMPGHAGMACNNGNGCDKGTTCSNGVCGAPQMIINQCINADGCCPAGCNGMNDSDCLYWQPGVLQNVAPATLAGWTKCFTDTYDVAIQPALPTILQQCSEAKLLLACRKVGAASFQLVAMGLRADVLFDCGQGVNCTHQANGVGWYYNNAFSWGFVNGADPVNRDECDINAGPLRLCWHTLAGIGGYRCGDNTGLNGDATWERDVFQAN